MKKIAIPLLASILLFSPFLVSAAYGGLVQCDGVVLPGETGTKCNMAALINQIKFLMNWGLRLIILLTTAICAYVGGLYMYAGFTGDVGKANNAREYFSNIFWGILIMLFAWLIVRTILNYLVKPEFGLDLLTK